MVDVEKLRAQAQFDLCHKGPTQVPTEALIELLDRLEEGEAKRDAQAAHVARLDSAGHALYHELLQWSLTEGDPESVAAMKLWDLARSQAPTASLDRLMALVPREITAETGHKAGMLGDFHETIELTCPECLECDEEDGCEICGGGGTYLQRVPVEWDTIKAIHRRIVELSEQGGQG
ncbi:hypothetical protein MKP05_09590 [Halomonas sp. EGI 63088]|uniref:Zinc ribbon domain-containing protein n=1 Tax=Halomonas flagellata TaxID=2920385 RepID=A0ABS9RU53_9GAMM|nr:hypothetical protein [Halomonas flagellata]MCH4563381.1 hypothetical protein [Halomonas flagellata]